MSGPAPEPLRDAESGLFSEAFFRETVRFRVAAGRRQLHPVSIALVKVSGRASVARVVAAIEETFREADIACRRDDGAYAFILEDTPENGAVWTVERLSRALGGHGDDAPIVWAGVACYPAHALDADDLVARAAAALAAACDWPQHRIEVALPE